MCCVKHVEDTLQVLREGKKKLILKSLFHFLYILKILIIFNYFKNLK